MKTLKVLAGGKSQIVESWWAWPQGWTGRVALDCAAMCRCISLDAMTCTESRCTVLRCNAVELC